MNDDLYAFADQIGVAVFSFPLPECESISLENNNNYYIAIDETQLDTTADERVHLAHELGHCITGSFYNEYSPVDNRGKCEVTADKWAIKKLINEDEFMKQLKKGVELWDLAEYFNVTENYIKKAYHLYCEQVTVQR